MAAIAYFGPAGTFTEMALAAFEARGDLRERFGADAVDRVAAASPPAALELVRAGQAAAAVVPFESSVEGAVVPTLDGLTFGSRLQIVGELELDIAFSLVGRVAAAGDVHSVAAYPVAERQVRQWLEANLPGAAVQWASSNAGAAQDVAEGKADAAISTRLAGEQQGLTILADGIADVPDARTRFVLVCAPTAPPARTGHDRTSIIIEPRNEPGSLIAALQELSLRGIDMTRIESRPTRRDFGTYRFFIDAVGHLDDPLVAEALAALSRRTTVRFLGSWPAAVDAASTPPSVAESRAWIEALRAGDAP